MGQDDMKLFATNVGFGLVGGLFAGSMQALWNEPNYKTKMPSNYYANGMKLVKHNMILLGGIAGAYTLGTMFTKQLRGDKEDMYNKMAGACGAGLVAGSVMGNVPAAITACPGFAFISAVVDLTGNHLQATPEFIKKHHPMVPVKARPE
mmetsp:Transcript_28005/g.56410  ORF Transcript_28005/g.56410 Transcript_28005/m.56410 type:complete len:149 (+) Transcript_28005:61-507(+)|eukprot:CAMPEP_0196735500 /NCGR_PEP_ID=MMETSP1091-20130531/13932_1 /TAXON_ID=302021 /ORGANISM="Rhodomonas sp., Strain CCMP768" /LENGTH=148 /DNA_ID=CAMNT_0042079151 /DNA_START=61 /DNA_END=507 /DNA_ORIENTATION=+